MGRKTVILAIAFVLLAGTLASFSSPPPVDAAQKWRYQTMWAPSITLWRGDKYISDLMNILAAGELELTYYQGGALMTRADEIFDAVSKGALNMASDWPSYWEGKNTAFSLITSFPMWMTPGDYMLWFWQAGGLELSQELYGKYNIVWFPHSVTGPESGQRSNKPVSKGEDYKGLKMRQCGRLQAKILQDLGGAAIFMPGAEIYMALNRGTIDAAEFSVPECDWSMGFQESTKYWVLPGWHQPGPISGIMIHKGSWDKLPDRVKFMFKEASMATMMWAWSYFEYSSAEYTKRFKDKGTKLTHLDKATLEKIQDMAYKYLLADAEANADFAKIAFSQAKYMKDFAEWRTIQAPFTFGRVPHKIDEVYAKLEASAKKHKVYDQVIAVEKNVRARMEKQEFWKPGTKYVESPILAK